MERFCFSLTCFLLCFRLSAQSDTSIYYFDEDLNSCSEKKAVIIGKATKEQGKLRFTASNLKKNIPIFEGWFRDSTLSGKEGFFTYYNNSGRKESEGVFENNQENGYWLRWNNSGLTDSVLYENGKIMEQVSLFYDNNQLEIRSFVDHRNNVSEITKWYTREPVRSVRSVTKAVGHSGTETNYHKNGNVESVTVVEKGKTKSQRFFREDATEISKEEVAKNKKSPMEYAAEYEAKQPPDFPGGSGAFMMFFQQNFTPPKSLRNGTGQTVKVTFFIDKAGFAYDIKVSGSSDRDVEIEVMAVFKRMPAWKMNGYTGAGPITYTLDL